MSTEFSWFGEKKSPYLITIQNGVIILATSKNIHTGITQLYDSDSKPDVAFLKNCLKSFITYDLNKFCEMVKTLDKEKRNFEIVNEVIDDEISHLNTKISLLNGSRL